MKQCIHLLIALTLLTGHRRAAAQTAFALATNYFVGETAISVAAADVNGDGKVDLIVAVQGGALIVLTNNGSGGFGTNAIYTVRTSPSCVVAAVVNGDGKPDLISANWSRAC